MSKTTECEQSSAGFTVLRFARESARIEPPSQGTWSRRIGAAKIEWSRLSYAELEKTEGEIRHLADLIEQRYELSPLEARRQVRKFLAACGNWS
jgi:hypothetical protein